MAEQRTLNPEVEGSSPSWPMVLFSLKSSFTLMHYGSLKANLEQILPSAASPSAKICFKSFMAHAFFGKTGPWTSLHGPCFLLIISFMKKFEFIEHTADIGIKAYGKSLPELFQNSAEAMFTLLIDYKPCLLYTSPSPRDLSTSRMPSSA